MKLKDKVALVTGGNSGIGEATARLFAAEGAALTLVGRSEAKGNTVLAAIQSAGGRALWMQCDLRKSEDGPRAVQWTVRELGRLDLGCNSAGVTHRENMVDRCV